jgi:hypothetical protein
MTLSNRAPAYLASLRRRTSGSRFQVVLLLVVALAARILFLVLSGSYGQVINNDAYDYMRIAQSLVEGQGFAFGPGEPTAFRPFGYPIFLAALRAITGPSVVYIHLSQALIGALAVWPTYQIARRFTAGPMPFLVAASVALHPILIYLSALIAPESIALLALLMVVWLALRISAGGRRPLDAGLLVVTGAEAVLARPELLMLLALLPAAVIWLRLRGRPVSSGGTIAAACLLAAALALVPLAIRNRRVLLHGSPMPTLGGVTFWGSNNAAARGGWVLPTPDNWPDDDPPADVRGWPGLTEYESQARFYRASFDWLARNPDQAVDLLPRKLLRSWSLSYADEAKESSIPAPVAAANWVFGALALLGVALSLRSGAAGYWVLYAALLAWLLKTVIFYGSARQTALALPIALVFAAVAVDWLWRRWRVGRA